MCIFWTKMATALAILFLSLTFTAAEKIQKSTFALKSDVTSKPIPEAEFTDMVPYLYTNTKPVYKENGKILAVTVPTHGKILTPKTGNAFVDTILRAYNEHRHLVLRPDDLWLAITTAFGHYVNAHSEEMRTDFVEHKGKLTLKLKTAGNLYSANWDWLIDQMSEKIENNTKGDIRSWIEVDFSTSTKTTETVSRVVLMGILQKYFRYEFHFDCGIPKVTLLGSLQDWEELRKKASYLKTFNRKDLTHWADLLDTVLEQMVDSYSGKVDVEFWSHILLEEEWGSGGSDPAVVGWINVFIPFNEKGGNNIQYADTAKNRWGGVYLSEVPQSTTTFPVYINDNGREYNTTFIGGHIVGLYDEQDDSVRPSLDWAIIDITNYTDKTIDKNKPDTDKSSQATYKWEDFPEPNKYRSSVLSYDAQQMSKAYTVNHVFYIYAAVCIVLLRHQFF